MQLLCCYTMTIRTVNRRKICEGLFEKYLSHFRLNLGKGRKNECSNCRPISFLLIPRKVGLFVHVLLARILQLFITENTTSHTINCTSIHNRRQCRRNRGPNGVARPRNAETAGGCIFSPFRPVTILIFWMTFRSNSKTAGEPYHARVNVALVNNCAIMYESDEDFGTIPVAKTIKGIVKCYLVLGLIPVNWNT